VPRQTLVASLNLLLHPIGSGISLGFERSLRLSRGFCKRAYRAVQNVTEGGNVAPFKM
jgi:hypothetical protein